MIEKRLRIQFVKFFVKNGLGLKSYNIAVQILTVLKQHNFGSPFSIIGNAILKVLPYCTIKKVTRGKHRIVILLPVTYNRAFRISINLLKENGVSVTSGVNKYNYSNKFLNEVFDTINKKSKTYKTKIMHIKDIRFALSFR